MPKSIVLMAVVLVSIAYPYVVYCCSQHLSNYVFAAVIIVIAVSRILLARGQKSLSQWFFFAVLALYCGFMVTNNSQSLRLFYPTVVSCSLAFVFTVSLYTDETVIQRIARLGGQTISAAGLIYTWWLTLIWAVLLLGNGMVAGALALFEPVKAWAIYTGLLSYVVFALFILCESVFRHYYKKKYG